MKFQAQFYKLFATERRNQSLEEESFEIFEKSKPCLGKNLIKKNAAKRPNFSDFLAPYRKIQAKQRISVFVLKFQAQCYKLFASERRNQGLKEEFLRNSSLLAKIWLREMQ